MSDKIQLRGETVTVPLGSVHPNGFNPNRMTDAEYAAVRDALERHGQVAPIVTRVHPKIKDEYQIVDGEHRLRALNELGATDVMIHHLGELPDAQAMHINAVLTESRGANDSREFGKLLASLTETGMAIEEIAIGLPQDEVTLEDLRHYGDYDWKNEFKGAEEPKLPNEQDDKLAGSMTFGPFRLKADRAKEVGDRFDEVSKAMPHLNTAGIFHAIITGEDVTEDQENDG